jgi:Na+/proline symporter
MVTTPIAIGTTLLTVVVVATLGTWYTRGRVDSVEDFVTARHSADSGTLTATVIASSMGAWILFSPAEAGAAFGGVTAVVGYALGSAVPLLGYAKLGPRIRHLMPDGHALTEYAYVRYGRLMYGYVLCISVLYMFVFLAAEMTGITQALALVAAVPRWQTAVLIGGFVLLYTAYGGLEASIVTDTLQTIVLLPLLAIGFAGAIFALGGTNTVYEQVATTGPSLLDPGFVPGIRFGTYVSVAILGAEMLNQSWWQRVYAAKTDRALSRSFVVAAIAIVPMIVVSGLFGLAAAGLELVNTDPASPQYNGSIAFFAVVEASFPDWVTLAVVVLAVLLVMSTADTLFNALSSVVTVDLPRLVAAVEQSQLTRAARGLTVLVALGATYVGAQGYSVLQLFFTADLLAAATFLPLLYGLFSERPGGHAMFGASLSGLLVGLVFFPPLRGPISPLLGGASGLPDPSFFRSFTSAAFVSGVSAFVGAVATGSRYDLDRLRDDVSRLDAVAPDGGDRQ